MAACIICHAASAKYKCPRCFERYCSVACCKSHKEKECMPQDCKESIPERSLQTRMEDALALPNANSLSWNIIEETEDRVPQEKLQKLCESDKLKAMLGNPHLRAMMENLVNSTDPMMDMEQAMQEPLFVELADESLRIVEGDKNPDQFQPGFT